MRGATAFVGSAPSARSCASALSILSRVPPDDHEIACSTSSRPSTRATRSARAKSCAVPMPT
eukprot:1012421-Pleurochrysis_carterae.AAC.1